MRDLLKTKRKNENNIAFIKENWIPSAYSKHLISSYIEENREIKRQLQGVY